jgi:PKD repeat protein
VKQLYPLKSCLVFTLLLLCCIVKAQPLANFTANKTSGCSPLTVVFSDLSTGSPTSYEWDFGNSNSSIIKNPSATYVNPGTYTVKLKVTNAAGNHTVTKTAFITVFQNPVANFTMSSTRGCAPLAVNFQSTSTPGTGAITSYLWNFGDGNLNNSQSNPSNSYTTTGVKSPSLTITDANGCQHSVTKTDAINISQAHQVNFTVDVTRSCTVPFKPKFRPLVTPSGSYTYLWTTSNGQTSTDSIPLLQFNNKGVYDVSLRVTNNVGCSAVMSKPKLIKIESPVANFGVQPSSPYCEGTLLRFNNQSISDTVRSEYRWSINGLFVASTRHILERALNVGKNIITLEVTDSGCKHVKIDTITINAAPKARFTVDSAAFCKVPAVVKFTNTTSTQGPTTYLWNFGDGGTSNDFSPSHTYTTLGSYQAQLKATNSEGCSDSVMVRLAPFNPQARIMGQHTKNGCNPQTILFQLLEGQAKQFSSFEWRYKNQVISLDSQFNYTFTDTGLHIVTLKLKTAAGCELLLTDSIKIGQKFTVDFSADKRSGCFKSINPIQFTLFGNVPKEATYKWTFKNTTSYDKEPLVNLQDTGLHDVTLEINYHGCITKITKKDYLNVFSPIASFVLPDVECGGDSLLFVSQSKGADKWLWKLGDGRTDTTPSFKHLFASTGQYSVVLIVSNSITNCVDSMENTVHIPPMPNLSFVVSEPVGCAPHMTLLTNTSTIPTGGYPIMSVSWHFGGTIKSGNQVPQHFGARGYHKVTMVVRDTRNCVYELHKDSAVRVVGGSTRLHAINNIGCVPLETKFYDVTESDFPVKQWKWIFSNSDSLMTYAKDTVYKTFTESASPVQAEGFKIRLIVTDSIGCEYNHSNMALPSKPSSAIDIRRSIVCGAQNIIFQAPVSASQIIAPAKYKWELINNIITTSQFTRSFTDLDTTYTISLSVEDSLGCTSTKDSVFVVNNKKPIPGFFATPPKLDCYTPVVPITLIDTTVLGSTRIKRYEWFAGANYSTKERPALTFPEPGKYGVKLIIEDEAGCIDSAEIPDYIIIGGPQGYFTFTPKIGCQPLQVNFEAFSPNARHFIWDMGDGFVDTVDVKTFAYAYPRASKYLPYLTMVDSSGTCVKPFYSDSILVNPLPEPNFEVDKKVICVNTDLTFSNTTPKAGFVNKWKWIINDVDTIEQITPGSKTFVVPGTYTVKLIAIDYNGCVDSIIKPDFFTVNNDTIPPDIPNALRATVLDNQSVLFELNRNHEPDFASYRIYYNYINGVPANNAVKFIDDTSYVHDFINTLENTYSYTVSSIDVCNNMSTPSEIHTTVEVKASTTTNGVEVAWTPYQGFDSLSHYEVWRHHVDSANQFIFMANTSVDTLFFIDTTTTCFTTYYYRIKAVEKGGDGQFSWSDTAGAMPQYVPTMPSTKSVRATVLNDKHVLIEWRKREHKIPFTYLVYRMRDDETEFKSYKQFNDSFFIDTDVDVDKHSYSYVVYLKDQCGGLSEASNVSKTILLKVDLKENDLLKYDPIIHFTRYRDWSAGVKNYLILPVPFITSNRCNQPIPPSFISM